MFLKKLGAILATAIFSLSLIISVKAASLTADEQAIISALANNSISAGYTTQVTNYFLRDDVDVSSSDATTVINYINNAVSVAGSATKVSELTSAQKSALLDDLTAACSVLGLSVSVDSTSDIIVITDSSGNTVAVADYSDGTLATTNVNNYYTTNNYNNSSDNSGNTTNNYTTTGSSSSSSGSTSQSGVIKQTGIDLTITYSVIFVLVIVLAGCSYFTFKKDPTERQ